MVKQAIEPSQLQALRYMLYGALGGSALGAGGTALLGLPQLLKKRQIPTTNNQDIQVAIPNAQKEAGIADILKGPTPPGLQHAWAIPGIAAAAYGGYRGGHKLVEYLIHRRMKQKQDQELAGAEHEYQQQLGGSPTIKVSSDSLDRLYSLVEKNADLAGTLGQGTALTMAGLLALLAAKGGYNQTRGRTQEELLPKALKQKSYLQALKTPGVVEAELTPALSQ